MLRWTLKNYTDRTDVRLDRDKKLNAAKQTTRKAGVLAGVGMIASDMITDKKLGERPRMERPDSSAKDKYAQYLKDEFAKKETTEANRVYKTYDEKFGDAVASNTSTPTSTSTSTPTVFYIMQHATQSRNYCSY